MYAFWLKIDVLSGKKYWQQQMFGRLNIDLQTYVKLSKLVYSPSRSVINLPLYTVIIFGAFDIWGQNTHCVKYAKIRVLTDRYAAKYESIKIRILTYFMQ